MNEVAIFLPSYEGLQIEPDVNDAFGSLGRSLEQFAQKVNDELSKLRSIPVSGVGNVPLERLGDYLGPIPGEVRALAKVTLSQARAWAKRRGWLLADGGRGAPDLRHKFLRGAGPNEGADETGGCDTHNHDLGEHHHAIDVTSGLPSCILCVPTCADPQGTGPTYNHTHKVVGNTATVVGNTGSASILPAYYEVILLWRRTI